ncbi:MAG: VWA domain-containing protein [Phycisphaeraceae bacterium]|nr:VWA domain-containing protein [Phycisphaeraceae bacterium]
MAFRFDHPEYLWLLLLIVPIVWLGRRSLATVSPLRRWTAVGLRSVVLLVLILMLAGLQTVRWHEGLTVVGVVDGSESVRRLAAPPKSAAPDASGEQPEDVSEWVRGWIRQATGDRGPDDQFALIEYDGRPVVRSLPSAAVDLEAETVERPVEGTDGAAAIRLGMALYPPESGRRMLLVTDGNDTAGGEAQLLVAAQEAAAAGVPIDVLPLEYAIGSEVVVEGVYAPTEARRGQTIPVRVVMHGVQPASGTLYLRHDDSVIDLHPDPDTSGVAVTPADWAPRSDTAGYVAVRRLELTVPAGGANQFEAVFEPATGADSIAVNNRASTFTMVHGKGKVLVIDGEGGEAGQVLPEALKRRDVVVETRVPSAMPGTIAGLNRYDAVVLQNVAADRIPPAHQKMLAQYVNDLGGGLIMIGGPDSFAAGGWTNSPIDKILPVECQVPSQTVLPSGALVLVIDRSGSMASSVAGTNITQQEVANEASTLALSTLFPQDLVGVVAFDSRAEWVVNLQLNRDPSAVAAKIRRINPSGGTNIYSGLELAAEALIETDAAESAVRHIILLTDGNSTSGQYFRVIRDLRRAGGTLSTVGIGDSVDHNLLGNLARNGGGNYYPVQNPTQLPQIFVKEARQVRKNLIKEDEFTPQVQTTGSPVVRGINQTPPLRGLVLTGHKKDPRVFTPWLGPEGEPLFAHWQVGLGQTAAFTSDATRRWAAPWMSWSGYADFWVRCLRQISRSRSSGGYEMTSSFRGDRMQIRVDASASPGDESEGPFVNFLKVRGSVMTPDGELVPVELEQVAPGVYEGDIEAAETGNYVATLFARGRDGEAKAVFGGASRPPGPELRAFRSNRRVLEQIASITGGRVLGPDDVNPDLLFDRTNLQPSRSIQPVWRNLLILLLVLILLDVANRRIAWDPIAIAAAIRRGYERVLAAIKPSDAEKASATLGALKRRAAEVQASMATSGESEAAADEASPRADRKFEASGDVEAADDFAEAVGAAKVDQESSRKAKAARRAARKSSEDDEAGTTSRLMAAKRRARDQMKDEE